MALQRQTCELSKHPTLRMRFLNRALRILLVFSAMLAGFGRGAIGQQTSSPSPQEIVRQTLGHEIKANNGGAKFMFRDSKQTLHGSQTKLVIETNEATAGLLIEQDGKPLTPEQRQADEQRLSWLANNPEELQRKQKAERDDASRTTRMVQALPEAFLYEADGTEPGQQGVGRPGAQLLRFKFRPNPRYDPPSRVEQVLTGMQGYLLIDAKEHRIAKIDGTLIKEVSFGWGILGHLSKGGHFLVQQGELENDEWEVTRMDLAFSGKELLFKSFNFRSNETFTDFRPAPAHLTFAQAVEFLKKQSAELAANHGGNAGGDPHPR
jgi:hypothetical protein